MKILLAGGGTAGHINPALAIAGYIKHKAPIIVAAPTRAPANKTKTENIL